jgi:hypothetical protein
MGEVGGVARRLVRRTGGAGFVFGRLFGRLSFGGRGLRGTGRTAASFFRRRGFFGGPVVVAVKTIALKGDAYAAKYFVDRTVAIAGRAVGEGIVSKRLPGLKFVGAGLATVLVSGHR